jgi:hypothetical protein
VAQFNYDSFGNLRNASGMGASLPGNAGSATQTVAAIDNSDVNVPTINISLEDDAGIVAPINITHTISDSNLAYYTLSVAPIGSSNFKKVYRKTAAFREVSLLFLSQKLINLPKFHRHFWANSVLKLYKNKFLYRSVFLNMNFFR